MIRTEAAERENDSLKDKVLLLDRKIQILQEEKGILMSLEQCLKERCSELEDEVTSLKSGNTNKMKSNNSSHKQSTSTPAEDEGISSSERSITPEDIQRDASVYELYNVKNAIQPSEVKRQVEQSAELLLDDEEETTIEEVMEDFKNIINDVETENYLRNNKDGVNKKEEEVRVMIEEAQVKSKIRVCIDANSTNEDTVFDEETEIVPSNLVPQPPRRCRSFINFYVPTEDYECPSKEIFFENEGMYSSESSDSLLSASKCRRIKEECSSNNNREILEAIIEARERANVENRAVKRIEKKNSRRNESHRMRTLGKAKQGYKGEEGLEGVCARDRQRLDRFNEQKMKSKSLDRIDDGLDTMVDIVMTHQKVEDKPNAGLRPKSDSGLF